MTENSVRTSLSLSLSLSLYHAHTHTHTHTHRDCSDVAEIFQCRRLAKLRNEKKEEIMEREIYFESACIAAGEGSLFDSFVAANRILKPRQMNRYSQYNGLYIYKCTY